MKDTMLAVALTLILGGAACAADNAGSANGQTADLKPAAPEQNVKAPMPAADQVKDSAANLPAEKDKSPIQPTH